MVTCLFYEYKISDHVFIVLVFVLIYKYVQYSLMTLRQYAVFGSIIVGYKPVVTYGNEMLSLVVHVGINLDSKNSMKKIIT